MLKSAGSCSENQTPLQGFSVLLPATLKLNSFTGPFSSNLEGKILREKAWQRG